MRIPSQSEGPHVGNLKLFYQNKAGPHKDGEHGDPHIGMFLLTNRPLDTEPLVLKSVSPKKQPRSIWFNGSAGFQSTVLKVTLFPFK